MFGKHIYNIGNIIRETTLNCIVALNMIFPVTDSYCVATDFLFCSISVINVNSEMDSPNGLTGNESLHDLIDWLLQEDDVPCNDSLHRLTSPTIDARCPMRQYAARRQQWPLSNTSASETNGVPSDDRNTNSTSGLTRSQSFEDLIDSVLQQDDMLCDITAIDSSISAPTRSSTTTPKPSDVIMRQQHRCHRPKQYSCVVHSQSNTCTTTAPKPSDVSCDSSTAAIDTNTVPSCSYTAVPKPNPVSCDSNTTAIDSHSVPSHSQHHPHPNPVMCHATAALLQSTQTVSPPAATPPYPNQTVCHPTVPSSSQTLCPATATLAHSYRTATPPHLYHSVGCIT